MKKITTYTIFIQTLLLLSISTTSFASQKIKAGTAIPVKLKTPMESGSVQISSRFSGITSMDLILDDGSVVKEGTKVQGEVLETTKGGRLAGVPSITMKITHIMYNEKYIPLQTIPVKVQGEGNAKKTVRKTGVGAAIGAASNGGTGAAKGAAVMGGIHLLTNKGTLRLPAGVEINFTTAGDSVLN